LERCIRTERGHGSRAADETDDEIESVQASSPPFCGRFTIAALPNLFRDGLDLGALARRGRDDMDSSLRKSQDHCPAEPSASACHNGNVV
jgi:hypothetical protein